MNQMLLDNMHNRGKVKWNVDETNSESTSYKHKGKKEKYSDSESFAEVKTRSRRERDKYISNSSESDKKPRRKKYKPYEEISWELKKINPPMFNGEIEKGKESKS